MASIEFIQKRIVGKEKEIAKLQKKLERIRKAESFNWDDDHNPYYYGEDDLRYCLRDIAEAQEGLEKYKRQLEEATEKADSRNVKVILEFLEIWKDKVRKYYGDGLEAFFTDLQMVRAAHSRVSSCDYGSPEYEEAKAEADRLQEQFSIDRHGKWEKQMKYSPWRNKEVPTDVKVATGKYEYLKPYNDERNLSDAMEKLNKDLQMEADRKYDFIIERTNQIVGQITDASGLEIGYKQDLNGYIIGTKGTAKVQTIGAGGYNIQCFHFRTLIHKV